MFFVCSVVRCSLLFDLVLVTYCTDDQFLLLVFLNLYRIEVVVTTVVSSLVFSLFIVVIFRFVDFEFEIGGNNLREVSLSWIVTIRFIRIKLSMTEYF